MDEKKEIRVRFEIGEIKFEAEGSAELVERERSIFNNTLLPAAIEAIVRTRGVAQNTQNITSMGSLEVTQTPVVAELPEYNSTGTLVEDFSRTSLASFVKTKGAREHYDFILCAVYFNEKKNGIATFTSTTLKELYADAKKPEPGNMSMTLSELVRKGLIMEDSASKGSVPKVYVLTTDGEDAVRTMQPKVAKEKKAPSKPRKTQAKVESAYKNLNCDELHLSNYPDVKNFKEFKEKMMLILYIVTNEGKGEYFTTTDVLCIMTDIFGENAKKSQVEGVFRREIRWFKPEYVDGKKNLVKRKLLNEGKEYAKNLGKTEK